ncbi:MAG TPA: DUF6259 domain-containing protein [Chloroflexia bacterium]|nr:DUF6259 domain-containing protein [Chloroflexia bacterium]
MTYTVSSRALSVKIDPESGRLLRVRNLARDLDLIAGTPANPPFRLELAKIGVVESFEDFRCEPLANGLRLIWRAPHSITVTSDILVRGDDILFTVAAANAGSSTIDRIEYPILSGIGRLGGPGQDDLAHSHATGMLFHDPLDLFEPDPENRRRLRFSPYPEGFAGSTMQFMAYYARNRGGFFLGTEDGEKGLKWYNFYKESDYLGASILHKAAVLEPGRSLAPPYAVVFAPLLEGTWQEAGDRYRRWAFQQAWAQPGPRSRWLREEVGVCTFGINARHDRAAWLDEIHRMAGTPVFHILGPNWAKWGHDYHNNLPRCRDDWFPATFSPANMATIARNGDYWAPFEFDLLCSHAAEFADPVLENRMQHNDAELGLSDPGLVGFPFMCAGTEYWHQFHVERDERLIAEYGADALYYDISVSNLLLQCLATGHQHLPGAGTAIADAFTTMYRDTSAAMARTKGAYVPAGTEVISEIFLNVFDYYQARAEAGPYAPFEHNPYRAWLLAGRAEKIPLFTYVFQERAPLRMDGWAKLAPEAGDLFYWTAAQVLLNGGLFELNYEFSALEDLNGRSDDPAEHYYRFDERHHSIDPQKAAFVGEVARARVGPANRFLAYGHMLPAPAVDAPPVDLSYYTYNVGKGDAAIYEDRGTMTVPSALASAWEHDGRTIWLVANLLPQAQEIRVEGQTLTMPPRRIRVVEP